MIKKDLLLDVDEVIVFSGFVEAVNDFLGTNYVIDDFTEYYIDNAAIPKERLEEFNHFLNNRNLYDYAQLLPDAIETIERLSNYYNIYILSACVNGSNVEGSGRIFVDKYKFLLKKLPFINPKNFIFTGAKHLFKADVKIDDLISNFSRDEDVKLKILFPSYHNKDITDEELLVKGVIRAGYDWKTGWHEVEKILMMDLERNSFKR